MMFLPQRFRQNTNYPILASGRSAISEKKKESTFTREWVGDRTRQVTEAVTTSVIEQASSNTAGTSSARAISRQLETFRGNRQFSVESHVGRKTQIPQVTEALTHLSFSKLLRTQQGTSSARSHIKATGDVSRKQAV
ncbi:hypothetical protein HNY73_014539 [Argiope bruennichi]|uniref:Uncharacterized protein n=1 Tax=Argiope bruennichi TaxID=94029 RepID=A0A8T0ER27_ARGBR|nr:hypothetical protein HNY73_014539 [Argiope bruennichi]